MTEKRFTCETKTQGNRAYTQWYDNGKRITSSEYIINILNVLHEENQELKAFIKRLTNNCGVIVLMNGNAYNVKKVIDDLDD